MTALHVGLEVFPRETSLVLPFMSFISIPVPETSFAVSRCRQLWFQVLSHFGSTHLGLQTSQTPEWFVWAGGSLGHPVGLYGRSSNANNLTKL